jgi:hypothetical protein
MSTQRKQVSRALEVQPSPYCNIPLPNVLCSGDSHDGTDVILVDASADFIASGVKVGDIVYFPQSANIPCEVVKVFDATSLLLSNARTEPGLYTIYGSENNGGSNDGCALYVGTGGDITVEMAGGDVVALIGISDSSFLPILVNKVYTTTGTPASNIIALW